MFLTFFPQSPLPASTEIRLVVKVNQLRDMYGLPLSTSDPFSISSQFRADFRTLPLFRIPGTAVSGYVFDSYRTNADGSPVPVIGATIRVDAFPEANAVTDSRGYFTLTNVPAPEFFVHIDGGTANNAPPGSVYPSGGKVFHSVPGMSTVMPKAFAVYLPPMALGDVVPLRTDRAIDVFFGPTGLAELARMFPTNDQAAFRRVSVTFPPGSAVDNAGNPATEAVIIPVPPDRLPSPLPSNLTPKLVISVQAPGATRFDVPAPVIFPNLDGLAPGEKALFFSYNHAAGRWDVVGAGTATTTGTIATDPGVGIRAPGWHLVQVGTVSAGQPCTDQACVLATVLESDVVKVDLSGTVALTDIYDPNFRGLSISGADILKYSDFANNRIFYVAPCVQIGPGTGNPLDPPDLMGSFTADLVNFNQQRDPKSGVIRIQVLAGYSTGGPNRVTAGTDKESAFRTQQRLRYFGWPSSSQLPVQVDGNLNDATRHAIGLFDSAVQNQHKLTHQATIDQNWINASPVKAPLWRNLPATGTGWYRVDSDDHAWGTSWNRELIDAAGFTPNVPPLPVNDLSLRLRGNTTFHSGHETGIDIDIDTPSRDDAGKPGVANDDPWYRVWTAADGKKYLATADTRDANQNLVRNIVRYDPAADIYYASPLDRPPGVPAGNFDHLINGVEHTFTGLYDNQAKLAAISRFGLFVDNPSLSGGRRYDVAAVRAKIDDSRKANTPSGASAEVIFFNDPRLWTNPDGEGGFVRSENSHGGHFHVNVAGPSSPAAAPSPLFQPVGPIPLSTAPGFGSDTRLYYRFQLANGFELAGRSSLAGTFSEILSPNVDYTLTLYRPADNRWAVYRGRSNASGQVTDLGTLILDQFGGPDSDGDGIPDQGELALGTRPDLADSDGDGLSADAELTMGLNPNSLASFPTGIIASLPLRGEAKEVVVDESPAYVATGSYGLAIVEVSSINNPIILGQLELPGDATDVGVAPSLRLAAVAAGSAGVHLVDISDPMTPRLITTVPVSASRPEVFLTMPYVATGNSLSGVDLLTGTAFQTLNLGGGAVTDVAQEGTFLYTVDANRRLRAIELLNFTMTARGSLTMADGGGRLFVGGGVAYVTA